MGRISLSNKRINANISKNLKVINNYGENIENEDTIESFHMKDFIFDGFNAKYVIFRDVIFENIIFLNSAFENVEFTDVRFINCDLTNLDLREGSFNRVEILDCKMVGINLSDSSIQNTLIKDSIGEYGYFRFSKLKCVEFINTNLNNSDYQESSFNKCNFNKCSLIRAEFTGTKLKGIDFSSSEISGILSRIEDFKGGIFSAYQCVELSRYLGIVVKE